MDARCASTPVFPASTNLGTTKDSPRSTTATIGTIIFRIEPSCVPGGKNSVKAKKTTSDDTMAAQTIRLKSMLPVSLFAGLMSPEKNSCNDIRIAVTSR